jgi:hypothetical protein
MQERITKTGIEGQLETGGKTLENGCKKQVWLDVERRSKMR